MKLLLFDKNIKEKQKNLKLKRKDNFSLSEDEIEKEL